MWAWVRNLFSRDRGSDPPARLIDLPNQVRVPSPGLLNQLRAVDGRAEVVYVGQGRWWVGRVKPEAPRVRWGRVMLTRLLAGDGFDWDGEYRMNLLRARLMAQGFGLVVDEVIQGEPDGKLVHEFRLALWVERGGVFGLTVEEQAAAARAARLTAERDMEVQLTRWLWSRSQHGRGNPWIGYGGGRPIAMQQIRRLA